MRTELMDLMRHLISTEGDTGFLTAADEFDDSEDVNNRRFGELLRLYVEIQTSVRMSAPIRVESASRFATLNKYFDIDNGFRQYNLTYLNQIGPFYLKLRGDMGLIAADLMLLEEHPVRQLELTSVEADARLLSIIRNHRMDYMNELTLNFQYRKNRQEGEIGKAISLLESATLMRVTLSNVQNRLQIIPALFAGKANVPVGCELLIGTQRVAVK